MSFFAIIASILGLVKPVVAAGKDVSEALRPYQTIDPNDATLWHTVRYGKNGMKYCDVCQLQVLRATDLCSEAVRRRQAVMA